MQYKIMKADKKEKILEAAIKVFSGKGYDQATMDEIAMEANVSKGLLFFYYENKENLIIESALKSVPIEVMNAIDNTAYLDGNGILYDLGIKFLYYYKPSDLRNLFLYTVSNKNKYPALKDKLKDLCFTSFDNVFSRVEKMADMKLSLAKKRSFFGSLLCYLIWWDENDQSIEEYTTELVEGFLSY